ncbi:MAG: VIT1/CCC1 transporter family protein [Candidatus Omnitrophica bacterium]|nr:VIT1/CCC1 transporter family protein [Candidatus Omnitrophota bacterium]
MPKPSVLEELGVRPVYLDEAWHSPKGRLIREVIYGATDGLVTSLGFVIGVFGALQENQIILISGVAEATAGALSMGFSAYISSKSQSEFFLAEIQRERREIREMPDKEKEEVRKIYQAKGFSGEELEMVVKRITSNPSVWLRCMMEEELGLIVESFDKPSLVGIITACSYLAAAFLPIIPYFFLPLQEGFLWSVGVSMGILFLLGAGKTALTRTPPLKSGLESMGIGLIAALVGYGIGTISGYMIGPP